MTKGNGDLITFRGTPDDPKGSSVWKIDNDKSESQFFLGVECDLGTVSIYEYVPEDPGDQLWSTNGTDWVPDGSTMPPTSAPVPESTGLVTTTTAAEAVSAVPETTTSDAETTTNAAEEMTTTIAAPAETTTVPETTTTTSAIVETTTTAAESSTTSAAVPETTTSAAETTSNVELPAVVAVSGSFCTSDAPCEMCYGDCDEDEDCMGDLICEQRDGGDPVSGCSGGEESPSGEYLCTVFFALNLFLYAAQELKSLLYNIPQTLIIVSTLMPRVIWEVCLLPHRLLPRRLLSRLRPRPHPPRRPIQEDLCQHFLIPKPAHRLPHVPSVTEIVM